MTVYAPRGPDDFGDIRRPTTIEEALQDCIQAQADPQNIAVVPTNALMIDMLTILVRLKHS